MKNENYWANRIKIAQDKTLDRIYDEYVANIEKQYDRAIRDIEKDILAWYQRFADNNELSFADAQKLLKSDELEEFKWTVQDYIEKGKENGISADWAKELENASARVHISRLESLKYQLRAHAEELTQGKIRNTTDAAELAFTEGYYHTAFEFQKEIGVGFAMQMIDKARLEKILNTPWTTDNQTFTARCWTDKAKLVEAVNQELTRMVATGAAPKKAIESIAKQFNTSKSNAGKLIMTESAYFATASQGECYKDLDVDNYEVIGTLDKGMCDFCGEMDGKVFPVNKMQAGSTAPPFHPWCRCTTAPYYEDMVGVGQRFARDKDGKTYTVPSDMTFAEWKQKFVDNSAESGIIESGKRHINSEHSSSSLKSDISTENIRLGSKAFSHEAKEKLYQVERNISQNNYETAVLFDEFGNVVFEKQGDLKHVSFDEAEIKKMKGCVLTHNHPNGSVPTASDINMLRRGVLSEIRACNSRGAYVLRAPKKWNKEVSSYESITKLYWECMDEIGFKYRDIAAKNGKNILYYLTESEEEGLKLFSDRYGFEFIWEDK